jgi:hypothetical protein
MKKNNEKFFLLLARLESATHYVVLYLSIALLSANELYIYHSDLHIYTQKSHYDHMITHVIMKISFVILAWDCVNDLIYFIFEIVSRSFSK